MELYFKFDCSFQINCKLFAFDKDHMTWQERGRGTLRLNDREHHGSLHSRLGETLRWIVLKSHSRLYCAGLLFSIQSEVIVLIIYLNLPPKKGFYQNIV